MEQVSQFELLRRSLFERGVTDARHSHRFLRMGARLAAALSVAAGSLALQVQGLRTQARQSCCCSLNISEPMFSQAWLKATCFSAPPCG